MTSGVSVLSERDKGEEKEEADRGQPERARQQNHPRSAQRLLGHRDYTGFGPTHQEADDVEGDWRCGEALLFACPATLEQQIAQGTISTRVYGIKLRDKLVRLSGTAQSPSL